MLLVTLGTPSWNSLNKTPIGVEVVLSPRTYKSKLTCFIIVFSFFDSFCVHSCLLCHSLYLYSSEDSVERFSFELPAERNWAPHYLCRHGSQLRALLGLRVPKRGGRSMGTCTWWPAFSWLWDFGEILSLSLSLLLYLRFISPVQKQQQMRWENICRYTSPGGKQITFMNFNPGRKEQAEEIIQAGK